MKQNQTKPTITIAYKNSKFYVLTFNQNNCYLDTTTNKLYVRYGASFKAPLQEVQ